MYSLYIIYIILTVMLYLNNPLKVRAKWLIAQKAGILQNFRFFCKKLIPKYIYMNIQKIFDLIDKSKTFSVEMFWTFFMRTEVVHIDGYFYI